MNSAHDLTTRLSHEAERFDLLGGSPLDLGQVLDRAGEIKRGRRMRATIMMAAVVLAVAVPTALVATDRDHTTRPVTPAHTVQTDHSPLALGDLKTGDSPAHGYSQDGTWQLPVAANGLSGLRGKVAAAAAMDDGVMVAMRSSGDTTAYFIYSQGGLSDQAWPIEGGFAVSESGTVAAFVEPTGVVVAVQDRGRQSFELGKIPQGSGFDAVAVEGEDCSGRSEASDCTVYVRTSGLHPQTYAMRPHETVGTALDPELDRTVDVSSGRFAGFTSVSDDGSCSAVRDSKRTVLWETCDHQLGSFSPDGKLLSAMPAYFDGAGSSELAVLDAATGDVVLDLHATRDAYIRQAVWEDDRHLLAVVGDGPKAAILRIGLDGSREYAVPPTQTDPYTSPFVLPVR